MKGSMLDMAVGIIIGAAFATVVSSLVADVLMPPIGLALGGVDFADFFVVLSQGSPAGPYATVEAAQEAGAVTLNWGMFVNNIITFVIVSFAVFIVIRNVNRAKKKEEEAPAEPPKQEVLLGEIRDLLKTRS